MFFKQVLRGRPGGRLQFSGEGSKMAWLLSVHTECWFRASVAHTMGHRRHYVLDLFVHLCVCVFTNRLAVAFSSLLLYCRTLLSVLVRM